jgi:hypothetical protein
MNEIEILWVIYRYTRLELHNKGYLRTYRSPTTDFAEWIVSKVLRGHVCTNPVRKNFDVEVRKKKKKKWCIQVKSLAKHSTNPAGYTIPIDLLREQTTHFAFVYFKDLKPTEFSLITKNCFRIRFIDRNINRVTKKALIDAKNGGKAKEYKINLNQARFNRP